MTALKVSKCLFNTLLERIYRCTQYIQFLMFLMFLKVLFPDSMIIRFFTFYQIFEVINENFLIFSTTLRSDFFI